MSAKVNSPLKDGMGPGRFALQTSAEILESLFAYYGNLKKAGDEGKPIVWTSGIVPRELLHAADASVVHTEHLPFVLGFQGLGSHYMQIAEEHGFSKDCCGTHRCQLGCGISKAEEREPVWDQLFVPPDLILASNYPCMSESKAFLYLADYHKCPYYLIDTPINTWAAKPPYYAIEYLTDQYKGAIDFLREQGLNVDQDKLREAVRLTKQSILLWREINDLRKTPPTVMSASDGIVTSLLLAQALPPVQVVALFEKILEELKEKVEKKEGLLEEEKVRLMFWGVPPTFNMKFLDSVEKYGAVFSTSMIECATGGEYDPSYIDPGKPLESIAYKALTGIINAMQDNMIEYVVQNVKDFSIDGLVFAVKRSCGHLPGFIRQLKDAAYKESGIRSTIIDLDSMDHREFDDVTLRANLDSFVETLIASKS